MNEPIFEDNTAAPTEDIFPEETISSNIEGAAESDLTKDRTATLAAIGDLTDVHNEVEDRQDPSLAPPSGRPENQAFSQLRALQGQYRRTIDMIGSSELRQQKALQQRSQELQGLLELARDERADEDLRKAAVSTARDAAAQDLKQKANHSLEQRAVEGIVQTALIDDPYTQALHKIVGEDSTTALDQIQSRAEKHLIIQNYRESLKSKHEETSTSRKVADFIFGEVVLGITEGLRSTGFTEDGKSEGILKRTFLPGRSQRLDAQAIDEMTPAELTVFLDRITEDLDTNFLTKDFQGIQNRVFDELVEKTPEFKNAVQAVEVAFVLPALPKLGNTVKAVVRAGSRKHAKQALAEISAEAEVADLSTAAARIGMDAEDVVQAVLPKALNNAVGDDLVGVGQEAIEHFEAGRKLTEELINLNARSSLPDDVILNPSILTARAEKRITDTFKGRSIKDVEVQWEKFSDGTLVPKDVALIGKAKGDGGFVSKAGALNIKKQYGISGEAVQDASGQWFLRHVVPSVTDDLITPVRTASEGVSNSVGRSLLSAETVGDRSVQASAVLADRATAQTAKGISKILDQNYGRLGRKDQRSLDTIIEAATDTDQPWMDPSTLAMAWKKTTGKNIPARAQDAYYDIRRGMSATFYLMNQQARKRLLREGKEHVKLPSELGEGNARVVRDATEAPSGRVYNATTGSNHVDELGSQLTKEQWKALKDQGYVRVDLDEAIKLADGTRTSQIIAKASSIDVSPVRQIQIPYRNGVHRMYRGKHFAKAATRIVQPDTGKSVLTSPKAFRNFATAKQANEWVEVMNRANASYRESPDDLGSLAEIFGGRNNFPSPEEYVEFVREGDIDVDEVIEAVLDGHQPSAYNGADFETARFLSSQDLKHSSLHLMGRTQGRAFSGKRGEKLLGFDGKEAPTLSLHETLNNAARHVSKLNGFEEHLVTSYERVYKGFSKYFDSKKMTTVGSVRALVDNAVLAKNTPEAIRDQFEAQRQILKRQAGGAVESDVLFNGINQTVQEFLIDSNVYKGVEIARWLDETNPANALRGFAFHAKLGFFNPSQAFVQSSSAIVAAASFPKSFPDAFQAFAAGSFMKFAGQYGPRAAKVLEDNPKLLKAMGFEGNKAGAREMVEAFHASGWLEVAGSHQVMNHQKGLIGKGSGALAETFRKAKKTSTVFFDQAEKFNRSVGWTIAWRQAADEFGVPLSRLNPAHMERVNQLTNDFTFQMLRTSQAKWQTGLSSLPTQFWAYPARMHELIFKGATFDKSTRLKLAASQTALFGATGTVVGAVGLKALEKTRAGEPIGKDEVVPYTLSRGSLDAALNYIAGGDTDIVIGGRVGTGNFLPDLVATIMNQSPYGEKSTAEIAGGVSFSSAADVVIDGVQVLKYAAATRGDFTNELNKDALLTLSRNISSVNNTYKSYLAFKHQEIVSKSGFISDSEVTQPEAFAAMLGFNSAAFANSAQMSDYMNDRKTVVRDLSNHITSLANQALRNPDRADSFYEAINALAMKHQDDLDIWADATKAASDRIGAEGFAQDIQKRFEKVQAKAQLADAISDVEIPQE